MFFYCITPPARLLFTEVVNALRAALSPSARVVAHVTVRGPCTELASQKEHEKWDSIVRGKPISYGAAYGGVGTFYTGDNGVQNTVYLKVHAPVLERVWHKPDYPVFMPHMSIYNGPSRQEAEAVEALLERYPLVCHTELPPVTVLIKGSLLREHAYPRVMADATRYAKGTDLDLAEKILRAHHLRMRGESDIG